MRIVRDGDVDFEPIPQKVSERRQTIPQKFSLFDDSDSESQTAVPSKQQKSKEDQLESKEQSPEPIQDPIDELEAYVQGQLYNADEMNCLLMTDELQV